MSDLEVIQRKALELSQAVEWYHKGLAPLESVKKSIGALEYYFEKFSTEQNDGKTLIYKNLEGSKKLKTANLQPKNCRM